MSTILSKDENELLKKSIFEIRNLKKEITDLKTKQIEPIAIVGMSCELPGNVSSPDDFWKFISEKGDGIRRPIEKRWNLTNVKNIDYREVYFNGGFISYDISEFDPLYFGIPPKEANYMDPQHRLFLENSWKALIDAGIDPKSVSGSNTGVFCGITNNEYLQLMLNELSEEEFNPYITSGNCLNFSAGRVSYILGLNGPSLAIDTACSSSLVAVHTAVQSLRTNKCGMAIAGGVSLMLSPQTFLLLKNGNMLSAEGRCKTFDESADGYARGEGCGAVILKRLSDAIAAGDRIYATIKNTAVQHDGKKSGLTVPISSSQKVLLKEAISEVNIEAKNITYSEAHGTGTLLGDPVELEALHAVYGQGRSVGQPLYISSIKSNFGHLESAAGIASLIKVALSIYHKKIPPHFSIDKLNSNFDWENSQLKVATDCLDWPKNSEKLATVSSFGASGTNAHAILGANDEPISQDFINRLAMIDYPKFKKQHCWYKSSSISEKVDTSNVVKKINKINVAPSINKATYLVSVDIDSVPTIREHRIFDSIVLTGSIALDIALTVTKELVGRENLKTFSFSNVVFLKPIVVSSNLINFKVTFEELDFVNQDKSYRIQMFEQNEEGYFDDVMYSSIDIQFLKTDPVEIDESYVGNAIDSTNEELVASDFYSEFWSGKFSIGKPFHIFDKVWRNDGVIAVGLCRPKDFITRTNAYGLDPESLIAYLIGLLFKSALPRDQIHGLSLENKIFIGAGYDFGMFLDSLLQEELYAVAEIKKFEESNLQYNGDLTMVSPSGRIVCKMTNIAFHAISKTEMPQGAIPKEKDVTKEYSASRLNGHPFLGEKYSKIKDLVVATEIERDTYPLIGDHLTFNYALLPAIGYINLASQAIRKVNPKYKFTKLENLEITQPLMLHKGDRYELRSSISKSSPHDYSYGIYAYSCKKNILNKEWSLSCKGDFTDAKQIPDEKSVFSKDSLSTFEKQYDTKEFFKLFWGDNFFLGDSYHFVQTVWRKPYEVVGVIKHFEKYKEKTGITDLSGGFLQVYMSLPLAMAVVPDDYLDKVQRAEATCIAKSAERFIIYDDNGLDQYSELWAHGVLVNKDKLDDNWVTDFKFYNERGDLVAKIDGAKFHIMKKEALEILKESMDQTEIKTPDKKIEVLPFLKKEIGEILGISVEQLTDDINLGGLMDSIMTLKLRSKIEKNLAILLPLNNFANIKSINELAYEITTRSNGLLE
ncbi:beta-ketoacyl synthase N-terminal-like domain-containing protein [Chromobacterium piscinae]|uniref:Beta-ketoacyl synthase N-terminal-like domain-containing protein n=10 Tax=Chromobacterium piscinae TaxID=686831 RepID=A0ABV0H3Q3_9NEIS